MNRKSSFGLIVAAAVMFGVVPFVSAQSEESGTAGQFGGGADGTNNLVAPSDTPVPEPTMAPDHEDTNTVVIDPDPAKIGKIEIEKANDGSQANVLESGRLVERIQLTAGTAGCFDGAAQIGTVELCDGQSARLTLTNRGNYSCPSSGGNIYGPCVIESTE